MKKIIIAALACVLIVKSVQAEETKPPQITVFGTATTEVVPDQMTWAVQVKTENAELETAAREHAKTVQSVLDGLKKSKVEEKTVQTSRMEFGENREYVSNSWVKKGYYAKTDISFKITDLDLYKKLWQTLAAIPGVSVENVGYEHTKEIEYRNETRQKALLAAREKASAMAETLGAKIGEPLEVDEDLSISEGWSGYGYAAGNNLRTADGNSSPREGVSLGTIPIKARVKTTFRLLSPQK